MTVRAVEWKNPYTWGKAIEIDENKVISLRLRDENNLIIWDEWDNEIYVDLQLDDEIRPTDAFPVWITTGRVIIDNGWDKTWTLICAKTTSGDNIKIFYSDDGHLYVDNWTWLFTQVYLKPEVDALLLELRNYVNTELAKKQDKLIAWDNIEIAQDWKTISAILPPLNRFLSLWDCSTGMPISFPSTQLPFEYESWDHFLVETVDSTTNYRPNWTEYDGTASQTVETADVEVWDVYIYDWTTWLLQINHDKAVSFANIAWQPSDNQALSQALNSKQDTLTAWTWINIDSSDNITNTLPWAIKSSTAPSNPSQWDLWYDTTNNKLKSYDGTNWNIVGWATYSAWDGISINNNTITNTLPWVIVSSSTPSSPTQGTYWYNTTYDTLLYYNWSSWKYAYNVKTFRLSSLSDSTTLQAISDWIINWAVQNCIAVINYNMWQYYLNSWITTIERIGTTTYMVYHFYFRSVQNFATTSGWTTTIYQKQLDVYYRTPWDTYTCTATDETITTITEWITNDTTGTTTTVSKLWAGTSAELALITKDTDTLYISF